MFDTLRSRSTDQAPPATVNRPRVIVLSLLAGLVLAVVWSYEFVDGVIGDNIANTLLGYDAKEAAITSLLAGLAFAFVSGLACTFTACNVAAMSMVAPLVNGTGAAARPGMRAALRPLAWLAVGAVTISAAYGAIGVMLGDRLPQLSAATLDNGMPVRLVQSSIVFGLIGIAFLYLGLAALGVLRDPLAHRDPRVRLMILGALLGALLIGRPFPLFFKLFVYAAETDNPAYGALAFVLQSLGNLTVVALLFMLVISVAGGAVPRWLAARPGRATAIAAAGLLVAGAFTLVYWDVRLPAMFGLGWFPTMPWNA